MQTSSDIWSSHLRLRKTIGILGLLLPFLVYLFHGELLASISHYYYTDSAVFFIIIISVYGFFLISYRGHKPKENEFLSDDNITTIGGIGALLLVLFPTNCAENGSTMGDICLHDTTILLGIQPSIANVIHFADAGVFMFSVGWMSFVKFTLGSKNNWERGKHIFYKIYGIIIWGSIAILLIETIIGKSFTYYDTFLFETIAVFAFGISWLVKEKTLESGNEKNDELENK